MYEPYDKATASADDRVAWALCQIIDGDAPMRWTRYRGVVDCIANNPEVMADLNKLAGNHAAKNEDTERLDWLALNPRGAEIEVEGKRKHCVFWGVAGSPEVTLREAIDAVRKGS